jgi:hypothetical protein
MICMISSTWMLWIWHFSTASSCKLLENLICFSLIILYRNVLFTSHHLYHVLCLLTLYFFLTNRNMVVEVEKTRTAVGFLDPEGLFLTTLKSTKNTLLSLCPICAMPSNYMLKRISCLPLISVWTTGLQWWSFRSSRRSTIWIHWRQLRLILTLSNKSLMSKLFLS